jgi:hypothetical protein
LLLNEEYDYKGTRSRKNCLCKFESNKKILILNENLQKISSQFTTFGDSLKNQNELTCKKKQTWLRKELIRLIYGYEKYKSQTHTILHVKNDFLLGFFIGRTTTQMQDAIKNLKKNSKKFSELVVASKKYNPKSFKFDETIEYLEKLGVVLSETGKEAYKVVHEQVSQDYKIETSLFSQICENEKDAIETSNQNIDMKNITGLTEMKDIISVVDSFWDMEDDISNEIGINQTYLESELQTSINLGITQPFTFSQEVKNELNQEKYGILSRRKIQM